MGQMLRLARRLPTIRHIAPTRRIARWGLFCRSRHAQPRPGRDALKTDLFFGGLGRMAQGSEVTTKGCYTPAREELREYGLSLPVRVLASFDWDLLSVWLRCREASSSLGTDYEHAFPQDGE